MHLPFSLLSAPLSAIGFSDFWCQFQMSYVTYEACKTHTIIPSTYPQIPPLHEQGTYIGDSFMKKTLVILLALVGLVGCGPSSPETTVALTEEIIEREPTATATSVPTTTPSPTPTLSPEAQRQEEFTAAADDVCKDAFIIDAEHTWDRTLGLPAVALQNIEYEGDAWELSDLIPAPDDLEAAQTIVCIKQTRINKGNYVPIGGTAYQIQWDIWLVSWPEGALIGSRTFLGGSPPQTKTGPGDRYGMMPTSSSLDWIEPALSEPLADLDIFGYSLAYIPDRGSLLTNYRMTVYEVDAVTGEQLGTSEFSDPSTSNVTYSPDGRLAAAWLCTQVDEGRCTSGEVEVISLLSGEKVFTLRGAPEYPYVLSLAFSPDSRTLITGHSGTIDGTTREQIWRWDMSYGQGIVLLEGEVGSVNELRISPNGETFLANINAGLRLLDVQSGAQVSSVPRQGNWPSFEFSPDGSMLAVGYCLSIEGQQCAQGGVMLWDLEAEAEIASWLSGESNIYSIAFSPEGSSLATASCSQRRLMLTNESEPIQICTAADIDIWSTTDGARLQTLTGHTDGIPSMAFSLDGTQLFSIGYGGLIRLWNID